ncbi:hypothetical protein ABIC37_006052 [Priestia megaterium]
MEQRWRLRQAGVIVYHWPNQWKRLCEVSVFFGMPKRSE